MKLELLGIASDIAGGKLGSAEGVKALCSYLVNHGFIEFGRHGCLSLDSSQIEPASCDDYAKHIALLYEFFSQQVAPSIKDMICNKALPLIISGDHSSAIGLVQGVQNALPNERVGVIWIDAHADIHTPLSTFSGNLHGMPLAALINEHTPNKNAITTQQAHYWGKISAITPRSLQPSDIVYCGIRSLEQAEWEVIERHDIAVLNIQNLKENMQSCLKQMQAKLQHATKIYVSVDIDVLDCAVFEATGCNEPDGFDMSHLQALTRGIIETFADKIVAFELSEFNPLLGSQQAQDMAITQEYLKDIIHTLHTSMNLKG